MQFNAIAMPCNAMQFHAIPCNSYRVTFVVILKDLNQECQLRIMLTLSVYQVSVPPSVVSLS